MRTPFQVDVREIEAQASSFAPIALADMEGVRLMNRTDTKFMLPLHQLPELLTALQPHYAWLEIDGNRLCTYETLYFDTDELRFYHDHRTRRLNRYKIRQRHYVQSNLTFTEVKLKNNKGRTIKTRIPTASRPGMGFDDASTAFLMQYTGYETAHLRPVLWVNYTRLTLVSQTTAERLTIDLDVCFRNGTQQRGYPQVVIAELKQDALKASEFLKLMKQYRMREGSLSKYCLGLISLDHTLKQNLFKPKLKQLHKLIADDAPVATPLYA
ncbi:polyphosphate polymerase domain-containing protein [Larkinella sp. C7]|jgi:hypothetical protein|uniref:polyphosphate polymerase domain-containing protein n=1 Tax=Larkinella sp. C7 TaxID=2576607 RepID=UPI0011110D9B|nr:polyphosphate polymerase domain-containing protein [Larkinella sp. C7]